MVTNPSLKLDENQIQRFKCLVDEKNEKFYMEFMWKGKTVVNKFNLKIQKVIPSKIINSVISNDPKNWKKL